MTWAPVRALIVLFSDLLLLGLSMELTMIRDAARDIITRLLSKDPRKRATAEEALDSSWIREREKVMREWYVEQVRETYIGGK